MNENFIFKKVFPFVLFVLFLYFFGIPALSKFMKKMTFIHKGKIENDFQFPAVTICRTNEVKSGWKQPKWKKYGGVLEKECKGYNTLKDLLECIDTKTYTLQEMIDFQRMQPRVNESFWKEHITLTFFGKCYTYINDGSREIGMKIGFTGKKKKEKNKEEKILKGTEDKIKEEQVNNKVKEKENLKEEDNKNETNNEKNKK